MGPVLRLSDLNNQGRPVVFGPVTIGKQGGIPIGRKSFSWDEIEEVAINKGVLSVKKEAAAGLTVPRPLLARTPT